MRLHLPRLVRDERGTSLIELGFFAPFLAVLAMGVIDLSRGLAERFALQQAVNESLELVQARPAVANAKATDLDYDFAKQAAQATAGNDATVTLTRWLECNGNERGAATGSCADGEEEARYLRIRITKDFHGSFSFTTIRMHATGALRTQ
jgi:Flp pilus assembly protein TadG